jgi:hypothetical protein
VPSQERISATVSRIVRTTYGIERTGTAGELEAFGKWLTGWSWDHFATLTFDERWGEAGPSADRCLSITQGWLQSLPYNPGFFVCVERGGHGRNHSHALIQPGCGNAHVPSRELSERWKFGRDHIRDFDARAGAGWYVSKYILKSPEHWFVDRLANFVQRML